LSAPEFFLGQGNRLPVIKYVLLQPVEGPPGRQPAKRCPIDLTGCTVTFQMVGTDGCCGGRVIGGTATIVDAKGGCVSYAWAAGDTDIAGTYRATWTVTTAAGLKLDFPNNGYIIVSIRPKVGN